MSEAFAIRGSGACKWDEAMLHCAVRADILLNFDSGDGGARAPLNPGVPETVAFAALEGSQERQQGPDKVL